MRYSILVPSYDPDGMNREMFMRLMESIDLNSQGRDYELIVRKNGRSYTESHNDALRSSRGDYIVILNDDVLIQDADWLEKLTSDTHIVSWSSGTFYYDGSECWDFACWAMARPIFEKIGYFDARFKDGINFEDNDYVFRARELGIPFIVRNIKLTHYGGQVLQTYYRGTHNTKAEHNHRLFFEKWKPLSTQEERLT